MFFQVAALSRFARERLARPATARADERQHPEEAQRGNMTTAGRAAAS
jgi:hypothetical protein